MDDELRNPPVPVSDHEFERALRKAHADQDDQLRRPTILVCGYTGTGKTTLIQSICGRGVVSDDKIVHGRPGTMDYLNYESGLVNFWDSQGFEPGQTEAEFLDTSRRFFRDRQAAPNVDDHIHLVWYCIQGSGARVTSADLELIKNVFKNVIVVITKADITKHKQMQAIDGVLTREGVRSDRIVPVSDEDIESRRDLVRISYELLPEAYRDAFVAAQFVDIEQKQRRAQAIIHASASAAAGIGATPIPIADAALLAPVQMSMIAGLSALYGSLEEAPKGALLTMAGEALGVATASSLIKAFPGAGNIIQGGVAAAVTEGIGQIANQYLIACYEAKIAGEETPAFHFDMEQFRSLVSSKRRQLLG